MQVTEGLALFAAREDDEDVEVVSELLLLLLIVISWTTELTAWTLQSEHAQALPHTDVEEEEEEEVAEDDEEEDDEDEDVREASASGSPLALRQALPPSSPRVPAPQCASMPPTDTETTSGMSAPMPQTTPAPAPAPAPALLISIIR
jgi:hypothetical protein